MKKIFTPKVLVIAAFAVLVMAAGTAVKYSNTPPVSMTGAPSESECTSCHSGSVNPTPSNLNNLTLTLPFTAGGYVPDSTYSVTLSYTQSGISKYGFQVTALTKSSNNPCGTLTSGTGSTKLTATISGKTREYITHSSSNSGTWVFSWKAPSNPNDSVIFYVAVNATNSNSGTGGDQVYLKQFIFGPSALLPKASITVSNDTVCVGDTVYFTGSGTNSPTAYNWKFRGNPSTSTAQNPKVVYTSAGLFTDTLRVTNAKGVSAPAVVTIRVNAKPVASITSVSPNDTICQGDTVVLTANTLAGAKYLWNTGNSNDNLQTLKVAKSGVYNVTVTNSAGCAATSSSVTITVNPKPIVSLAASADSVCAGSAILFTATPTGAASYIFSRNGTVVQNTSSNTYNHTFTAADTISVVAVNGCQSTPALKLVKFFPKLNAPTVSCGNPTTSSVTFNWTSVNGTTGYQVSIDSGKTWITPSSGSTGLSHTVSGLGFNKTIALEVRGITTAPCNFTSSSGSTYCTTLSCSGVTYNVVIGDTLICPGDSTSITIKNISAPKFSIKFNNGSYKKDSVFWVKPTTKTQYPFELIDSANLACPPATFTASVNVENPGTLAIQVLPGTTVCAGTPLIISSSNTSFTSYDLQVNGNTVQTKTTPSFTFNGVANNNSLRLVGTSAGGCKVTSAASQITVNPLPKVGFTATVNKRTVNFDDTTSTTSGRVWNFGDNTPVETAKAPSHTYATVGTFDVKLIVQDANQCRDSVSKQITTNNVAIGEIAGLSGLEVYPNPAQGKVTIAFNWAGAENIQLKITDLAGKAVWSETISTVGVQSHTVNMETFAAGMYLLHLQTSDGETTVKILKQGK